MARASPGPSLAGSRVKAGTTLGCEALSDAPTRALKTARVSPPSFVLARSALRAKRGRWASARGDALREAPSSSAPLWLRAM
jgi:hypothetical protein